jgi:hypothetical protein
MSTTIIEPAAQAPAEAAHPLVTRHLERLSELIDKAERVAATLLDNLLRRAERQEQVYPGELIHVCRGLHALARCATELGRLTRGPRGAARISETQVQQLEARLRATLGL